MIEFNPNPGPRELRSFSAALIVLSTVASVVVYRRAGWLPWAEGIALAIALLGVFGLIWPSLVRSVYRVWHVVTFPIGWLVSHLILGVIFYLLIAPIGLTLRLLGKDSMKRKFDRSAASYWEARTAERPDSDYFRQF